MRRDPFMSMCLAAFVVISAALVTAQEPSGSIDFKWDWRQSQELSWKQSISLTKTLPPSARNKLVDAMTAQLRPGMAHLQIGSENELRKVATDTQVKFVSLAPQTRLVVAQAAGEKSGCSPTGNCPFWLFQSVRGDYVLLLAGEAQTFTIQTTKNNGMPDIVLGRHGSAFESELIVYKFDGNKYAAGPCYLATRRDVKTARKYREPHLRYCGAPEPQS